MMQWTDEGLVLGVKPFGEDRYVVTLLAQQHGLHRGLALRKKCMVGDIVQCSWSARLPEHLGRWRLELLRSYAAVAMRDRAKLSLLLLVSEMLCALLPERANHQSAFQSTLVFCESLVGRPADALVHYLFWECAMLRHVGRALDFRDAALATEADPLRYVSPRTGRVVTRSVGWEYRERLLLFPQCLLQGHSASVDRQSAEAGFALTGHFLLLDSHYADLRRDRAAILLPLLERLLTD